MTHVHQKSLLTSILYKVIDKFPWLFFYLIWLASSSIAFYRYALLLLRKSEGEQRMSNQSESDNDDNVRIETTNLLHQKNHKRRRWINKQKKRPIWFSFDSFFWIEKLVQFSRGCSMPPSSTDNLTQQSQCLSNKAEGKTTCVKYCQVNLCNKEDIRWISLKYSIYLYWCFFKRWRSNNNNHSIDLRRLLSFGSATRDHIHTESLLIMTFFFTIFVRMW
jgi:hypothetical protein